MPEVSASRRKSVHCHDAMRVGFTLVELLVVIGIIGILIAILMPALSRARVQAKTAVCLSNLHQMSLAMGMYLAQSKGVFPGHRQSPTVLNDKDGTGWWGMSLQPYIKNTAIFQCPDMPSDPQFDNGFVWQFKFDPFNVSYGYNAYFLGHAAYPESMTEGFLPAQNWMKITQVKRSTMTLMFADSSPPYVFSLWWPKAATSAPGAAVGNEGVTTRRHRGVGCVVFVDGHTEKRVDKEINPKYNPIQFPDRTNLQWWDPKQR
ncbi:MAG: prepilin-type N-terminal cleavage/methylation domain-containing protein [Tepidisphaeraceae bacterium]